MNGFEGSFKDVNVDQTAGGLGFLLPVKEMFCFISSFFQLLVQFQSFVGTWSPCSSPDCQPVVSPELQSSAESTRITFKAFL